MHKTKGKNSKGKKTVKSPKRRLSTKANQESTSKERKLQIDKEIRKLKREEQLKAGVKLTTRIIPDKKKYVRRKKIQEDSDE